MADLRCQQSEAVKKVWHEDGTFTEEPEVIARNQGLMAVERALGVNKPPAVEKKQRAVQFNLLSTENT
jgi:hypothetical protein